jgi:NADH dehydrogenase
VLATGVTTNYFGNKEMEQKTYALKSVADALLFRNALLADLEKALTIREDDIRQGYLDLVIVGGGPTGVELAGSLAEFRKFILTKEYPELETREMDIHLIEGGQHLLNSFSLEASNKSRKYLEDLGVNVITEARVLSYEDNEVSLSDGRKLYARKVIWTAGITGSRFQGLPESSYTKNHRLKTDAYNKVEGMEGIYALGDAAYMEEGNYKGHPQVAQPAIQQARHLSKNLIALAKGKSMKPFHYHDLGSLATIGRNKAVADLPYLKTQGFIAWLLWLFVHLKSLLGVKNKIQVFFNWVWSYITMDQNLRILIRHKMK